MKKLFEENCYESTLSRKMIREAHLTGKQAGYLCQMPTASDLFFSSFFYWEVADLQIKFVPLSLHLPVVAMKHIELCRADGRSTTY